MDEQVHKKENSYSNILKRISSFGGVQAFNVVVNIVRGKLVALLLGPEGMGINSLFVSSTNTIQQFSSLGLNFAIVKEIASGKDEEGKLGHIMAAAFRLILLTAMLGGAACFVLSPWLSLWTFGDYSRTVAFMALSLSVALTTWGAGYLSLLQGMGEVKKIAKSSLVGGLTGLFFGIPLYYFFGDGGIVPAIIILSLSIFLFYFYSFRKTVAYEKIKFTWQSHKPIVRKLISLGLILMVSSLATTTTTYIINVFVRTFGSLDNVGFFQAANSLTNQYVGVIFTALAMDYFPRLSAAGKDTRRMNEVVNRQAEIVTLITTPLVILLILTTPLVIEILLTESFMSITTLMRWLGLGVLLQSVSFPMEYIFIANEHKKIYIWFEIVYANLSWIGFSILFYYLFGLDGLGISLVVRSFIDLIATYIICHKLLGFRYTLKVSGISGLCLLLGTAAFCASFLPDNISYFAMGIVFIVSLGFSLSFLLKGARKQ